MKFTLPEKQMTHIYLRSGRRRLKVTGDFKDAIYHAMSEKNIIRARTLLETEKAKYQVLGYTKHGGGTFGISADVEIMKLSKK